MEKNYLYKKMEKVWFIHYEMVFEKEEINNPWKYKIKGSADGESFGVLSDRTDNTDGARKQTGEISSEAAYRYVRVTITGLPSDSYRAAFAEFKVYTSNVLSNVALGKAANPSEGNNNASLEVDGNTNTFAGNVNSFPYWWTVDLGESFNLSGFNSPQLAA